MAIHFIPEGEPNRIPAKKLMKESFSVVRAIVLPSEETPNEIALELSNGTRICVWLE